MDQISRRLRLLAGLAQGDFTSGDETADGEFACLQLRKILEQIAFASLAANRERYADVRPRFDQEWRAKGILDQLEELHPDFYPVPVVPNRLGPNRVDFDVLAEGFLSRADFVLLYDKCSQAIHDWNPYKDGPQVIALERPIQAWAERIHRLLAFHQIRLLDSPEILVVEVFHPSGQAHVYRASPRAGR